VPTDGELGLAIYDLNQKIGGCRRRKARTPHRQAAQTRRNCATARHLKFTSCKRAQGGPPRHRSSPKII
jgi:hypothetical protein